MSNKLEKGCARSHPHENMDEVCILKTELVRTKEQLRLLTAYTNDCKGLLNEGVQIIEGLKAFFPEIIGLRKVQRFLKLAKELNARRNGDVTEDAT